MHHSAALDTGTSTKTQSKTIAIAEIALVFVVFFLHGAWPTPDVNETGCITKMVHYANPEAFAHDFFCNTGDVYIVFYWTFGWLTKLGLALDTVAWIGRLVTWLLLAIAWRTLSASVLPRPWLSVVAAQLFAMLTEQTHMAGEWIVGGFEAKGIAWALVLGSLAALVHGRWRTAWILVGIAASFHVVLGAWSAVCLAIVWLASSRSRPPLGSIAPAIIGGLFLALPGIYFACRMDASADWQTVLEANRIQVFERLPHHMLPTAFATGYVSRQLLLWAIFFLLCAHAPPSDGDRRLRKFVRATMAISLIGIVFAWLGSLDSETARDIAAFVLRFYLFRMSDILVPCGVALVGLQYLLALTTECKRFARTMFILLAILCGFDLWNQVRHQSWLPQSLGPPSSRADKFVNFADWRDVCRWAAENTSPGTRFITPRNAATFKWYAGRDEVGTWKDMPQDAANVAEWRRRMQTLFAANPPTAAKAWRTTLAEAGAEDIQKLAHEYGADYVIVEVVPDVPLPALEPVYKNKSFAIYEQSAHAK